MLALKQGLSLVSSNKVGGAGAWSPTDEASLEVWWQNAVGITLNGSNVSQWDDSSTNTYDLTQSTAASQPAYSGGILTFDGANTNLISPDFSLTGAFTIGMRGDFTTTGGTILGDDDTSNAWLKCFSTTVLRLRVSTGNASFTLSSGTFGDDYLVITRDASNVINTYRNGVQIGVSVTRSGNVKTDNLGFSLSGGYFTGTISEVQIYTSTSAALTTHVNSRLSTL